MLSYEEFKTGLLLHKQSLCNLKCFSSPEKLKCQYGHYKSHVTAGLQDKLTVHMTTTKLYHVDGTITNVIEPAPAPEPKAESIMIPCSQSDDFDEYVARKYIQLKESAKKRDKEFNLTLAIVRKLLNRKTCYYTGIPIGYTGSPISPNAFTVDRVDPNKGYVIGNVVACCYTANQFKSKIEHEFSGVISREKQLKMLQKMFA